MELILQFFKDFSLQNIISMAVIMWYFTRDIKKDMHKLASAMEHMNKEFHRMNTRVSRIEGNVYGKDIYEKVKE